MKLKLTAALCLVCSSVLAANVADNIQTALGQGFSGTNRVRFTPVQPWLLSSNASPVIGYPVGANTDTNGNFGATNIPGPAYYNFDVVNSGILPFRVLVPGGNATYTLWQISQFAQQAQYFQYITNTFTGTNGVNVAPGALMFASTNPAGPLVTISAYSQTNGVVATNDTRAVTLYNQVGGTNSNNTLQNPTNTGAYWGQQYSGGTPMKFSMDTTNGIHLLDGVGDSLGIGSNSMLLNDIANDALFLSGGSGANGMAQLQDGGGDSATLQSGKFSLSTGAQFAGNGAGLTNVPSSTNAINAVNATNLQGQLIQANIPSSLNYTGGVFSGNGLGVTNISGIGGTNLLQTATPELFGCKGDGSTDDTANFQKAVNACVTWIKAGLDVQLYCAPSVSYKITGPITNVMPLNIKGNNVQWKNNPILLLSGATAGMIYTNDGSFFFTGFKMEDFSFGSVAQAKGMVALKFYAPAGAGGPQALDLKNVTFYGIDKAIVLTNCDEINFDQITMVQCTNGIISDGTGTIQANCLRNIRAGCYGPALILGGGQYSVEHLDTSPLSASTHNVIFTRGATVNLFNCNIENASEDTSHYGVYIDSADVTASSGSWALPAGQPSVFLTNSGAVHFSGKVNLGADVNGHSIVSANSTGVELSTQLGGVNGGIFLTNNTMLYGFDSTPIHFRLSPIGVDYGSGVAASAGTVDTIKWSEVNSHAFWNGLFAGEVYQNNFYWADLLEFDRNWNRAITASYPSTRLTTYNIHVTSGSAGPGFAGDASGATNIPTSALVGAITNNTISVITNFAAPVNINNPLTTGVTFTSGNYNGLLTGTIIEYCPTNSGILAFLTNLTSTECQWFTNRYNFGGNTAANMVTNSQNFAMWLGPNESVQFTNFAASTNFLIQRSFLRITP